MKKQIIDILGTDHLDPIQFNVPRTTVYGLYTYQGEIYVFIDSEDICFDELYEDQQKIVTDEVVSKNWKVNPSLQ